MVMDLVGISNQSIIGLFSTNGGVLLGTFVYAKCSQIEQNDLWNHLRGISSMGVPWVVLGGFNIIRSDEEHIGGQSRPIGAMEEFNGCINSCGLIDFR